MVEMASYPTILFYEKLDENDNYTTSADFNLDDLKSSIITLEHFTILAILSNITKGLS